MEQVQNKVQTALAPGTQQDSVHTEILGLNRIIGGWCRYYQMTSSPSYYFNGLNKVLFEAMAHWLGRKYKMRISQAMRRFKKGNIFGTDRIVLQMRLEFKAKRHGLRAIRNPYGCVANVPLQVSRGRLFLCNSGA